ncbi:MAG: hypothetical protein EOM45_12655 [Clostridia bacterium]|nr:hypothetical protein [Clostridia bacterium]
MIIFSVLKHPMHASMKRMLSWIGVEAGFVRSPFSSLSTAAEAVLKEDLKHLKDTYHIEDVVVLKNL